MLDEVVESLDGHHRELDDTWCMRAMNISATIRDM